MNPFRSQLLAAGIAVLLSSAVAVTSAAPAEGNSLAPPLSLRQLSLEDLLRIEVSTVSRKSEEWWDAPGAIDVLTDEDIRRSGAMSLPDALRLATGVHVGQINAREWAIAIRGFNVNASNKLNVRLDGRNLFTPFFSGVLWDAQDTMMEDIARIEVMRGPAGALWGSYALNGFIQIITKPAWETQGWLTSTGGGTDTPVFASARYGGSLGSNSFYRVYAKYSQFRWTYEPGTSRRAAPTTDFAQTGFRSDTRVTGGGTFTLSGDAYTNKGTPKDHPQNEISGANLNARFDRPLAVDSDLRAMVYYDYTSKAFTDPFHERRHTASGSLKYHFIRGPHDAQVGSDFLVSRDHIRGGVLFLDPASRTYFSGSLYAQDTITLQPRWALIAGVQGLYTNFARFDVQPTLRLRWMPSSATTLWTAVSRAVRTPVRLDRDLVAQFGDVRAFEGNDAFKSETVVAWELGARSKFTESFAISVAGFINRYDNIRSYESATTTFRAFPWTFKNTTNVDSAGVEAMVLYQPLSRLFLKAGYRYLDFNLTKDPGSGDFQNGFYEANDPRHVAVVTARLDLPHHVEFDATVRHSSSLPNPSMRGFTTADVRLGWSPRPDWELALIGRNLFDPRHPEFTAANHPNDEVGRSLTAKVTWRY